MFEPTAVAAMHRPAVAVELVAIWFIATVVTVLGGAENRRVTAPLSIAIGKTERATG